MRTLILTVIFSAVALACLNTVAIAADSRGFESENLPVIEIALPPTDPGIREDVPAKYRSKFEKWKTEFLSTNFGRQQWETYANNDHFLLVIRVDPGRGMGAGTDKFTWDTDGNFIGATITIGSDLDNGFPEPIYYPVLNALAPEPGTAAIRPSVIAAAKLSHEIGHVEQTSNANMKLMQLQSKLIPQYVSIFLKNGFDHSDKRLLELEQQMGGTPTSIWESREYTSELDTMRYISQSIDIDDGLCRVLKRVRRNLAYYAAGHEKEFEAVPGMSSTLCSN
jgi:hypothetical protein